MTYIEYQLFLADREEWQRELLLGYKSEPLGRGVNGKWYPMSMIRSGLAFALARRGVDRFGRKS